MSLIQQARSKALRYCALRERAPSQVKLKLQKWGLSDLQVDEIIGDLKEEGFLDESRFASAYARDKHAFNQWGKIRISMQLKQLQISSQYIEEGLESIDNELYKETLKSLCIKKWNSLKSGDNYVLKHKTAQFLFGKGYEGDLVWKIIGQINFDKK